MLNNLLLALLFVLPIVSKGAPNPNDGEWDMTFVCETRRPHISGHNEVFFESAKIVNGKGEFRAQGDRGISNLSVEFENDTVHLKIFGYASKNPSWFWQLDERGPVAEHELFHFSGILWPGGRDNGILSNCVIDGVNVSRRK